MPILRDFIEVYFEAEIEKLCDGGVDKRFFNGLKQVKNVNIPRIIQ